MDEVNNPRKLDFPTKKEFNKGYAINFKIVVPSTREKSKRISQKAFQARVNEVMRYVTKLFRGSTIDYGYGTYTYHGKVIRENVAVVSVFTTQDVYNKLDIPLKKYVQKKKYAWGQDSMGFQYQDKLIFV